MNITGNVDLAVKVGSQLAVVQFYVVYKLGVDVILECNLRDKHVEAIRPRRHVVKLDDDITVPIIRDAITKTKNKVTIQETQIYAKQTRRSTDKMFTKEED